jgi:hypothetical protein
VAAVDSHSRTPGAAFQNGNMGIMAAAAAPHQLIQDYESEIYALNITKMDAVTHELLHARLIQKAALKYPHVKILDVKNLFFSRATALKIYKQKRIALLEK